MPRLYHPDVKDSEHDHPDDEASLAVMFESGWKVAPEPTSSSPAFVPEPVTYEPVKPAEPKRRGKSTDTD
jgi:hypothetical protein